MGQSVRVASLQLGNLQKCMSKTSALAELTTCYILHRITEQGQTVYDTGDFARQPLGVLRVEAMGMRTIAMTS